MTLRSVMIGSLLVFALASCSAIPDSENAAVQMASVSAAQSAIQRGFDAAGNTWQEKFDASQKAVRAERSRLVAVASSCTKPSDSDELKAGCGAAQAEAIQLLTYLPIAEIGSDAPDGKIGGIAGATSAFCAKHPGNYDCEVIALVQSTSRSGRAATELMAMAFGAPGARAASNVRNMISNFEQSVTTDWPALTNIKVTDDKSKETLANRKTLLIRQACQVQRSTDWMLDPASKRIPDNKDALALMTVRNQAIRAAVTAIKPGDCTPTSCTVKEMLDAFLDPHLCADI